MLKNIINRCTGSRFIVNTGWMMAERIYQILVSLAVSLLTARYLGPSNYGIINYVAAFVAFTKPICSLGLEGVIVKKFLDKPDKEGAIIGTAILMEFLASLFCSIAIIGIVAVSNAYDSVKIAVAVLESISLLFKSTEAIEFWYQSKLKSKYASIVKIIAYTVMSVYRIVLLIVGATVEWFAFATSLDMIVIAFLYLPLYQKQATQKLHIDFSIGKEMLKESYHFILSGLMAVLYSQMDKVMIQNMLGDTEVGLYSAAYTISSLWFLIPTSMIASARPLIMQAKKDNNEQYLLRVKQLYAAIFWLGIAVGICISLLRNPIMYILYGSKYMPASQTLAIGIWYGIFAELGSARGIWILCENKNKYTKYYLMWGVVVNFMLNWFWIPIWGISGAALATLVTQSFTAVLAPLMYRETRVHTRILIKAISLSWCIKKRRK